MENLLVHWREIELLTALAVFLIYILVDGMYAYYTLAVSKKKAFASATTGACMHFLLAFGVISYVQNYLYLIPLAAGSWLGTYIVVKKFDSLDKLLQQTS